MVNNNEVECCGCGLRFEPTLFCAFLPLNEEANRRGHCENCVKDGKVGDKPILLRDTEFVHKVCQKGSDRHHHFCRYLFSEGNGWHCAKGSSMGIIINKRAHLMRAKGDNCPGVRELEIL
jgi:hypothetical protein